MTRREFITLLGGAAAWPMAARAQQGERMRSVGVLMTFGADEAIGQTRVAALLQGLQQTGWEVGRNLRLTGGIRRVRDERNPTWHDHVEVGVSPPGGTYLRCNMAVAPGDPNPANCVFSSKAVFIELSPATFLCESCLLPLS